MKNMFNLYLAVKSVKMFEKLELNQIDLHR